jgi:hypothetical protein
MPARSLAVEAGYKKPAFFLSIFSSHRSSEDAFFTKGRAL